jgi:HD domain-containing protein
MLSGIRLVSEAAELAAHRHAGQQRKGRGSEAYVNHLAEVANLLSVATSGEDAELVAAGWLHDTMEDTETTRGELAQQFGPRVAGLVAEVTDNMTLPKDQRRRKQVEEAPKKSAGAKLIKSPIRSATSAPASFRTQAASNGRSSPTTLPGPSRSLPAAAAATPGSTSALMMWSEQRGTRCDCRPRIMRAG